MLVANKLRLDASNDATPKIIDITVIAQVAIIVFTALRLVFVIFFPFLSEFVENLMPQPFVFFIKYI